MGHEKDFSVHLRSPQRYGGCYYVEHQAWPNKDFNKAFSDLCALSPWFGYIKKRSGFHQWAFFQNFVSPQQPSGSFVIMSHSFFFVFFLNYSLLLQQPGWRVHLNAHTQRLVWLWMCSECICFTVVFSNNITMADIKHWEDSLSLMTVKQLKTADLWTKC